jgi:hypothetical protein
MSFLASGRHAVRSLAGRLLRLLSEPFLQCAIVESYREVVRAVIGGLGLLVQMGLLGRGACVKLLDWWRVVRFKRERKRATCYLGTTGEGVLGAREK